MSEISASPAVRIKDALYGLVRDKSYKEVTVVDISRIAHVNRKTFYNHYPSVDDALLSIEQDFVTGISEKLDKLSQDDFWEAVEIIYECLDDKDTVKRKFFYDRDYQFVRNYFLKDVLALPFFHSLSTSEQYSDMAQSMLKAVFSLYYRWVQDKTRLPLKRFSKIVSDMVYDGLEHFIT